MMRPSRLMSLSVLVLLLSLASLAAGERPASEVSPAVLAYVEKLLEQLRESDRKEPGPVVPRASEEAAYLLLAGLAAEGTEVQLTEREKVMLTSWAGRGKVRAVRAGEDVRLILEETWIQDKSGSYRMRSAKLFRRHGGAWRERGRGRSAR